MDKFTQNYLIQPVAVLLLRLLFIAQRRIFGLGLLGWQKRPSKGAALMRQVRWKIVKLVLSVERLLTQDMQQKENERHERKWRKLVKRKKSKLRSMK